MADVFDALTTRRPYKDAWSTADAVGLIREQSGAQFDPAVVRAFEAALPMILDIKRELRDERATAHADA